MRHVAAALVVVAALGCVDRSAGGVSLDGMTPEAHDRFFPIAAATKHGTASCNDCHGAEESFARFTCLSCHDHDEGPMNATHAGFPGYAYESQRCYACHQRGDVLAEIVHASFPIRAGAAHEGVSCASCHTDPADRKKLGCTSCHEHGVAPMKAIHDGMVGYAWESPRCFACHPGAEPIGLLAEHPSFPTSAGTKHEEASCRDCHLSREDRSELGCTSCHEHDEADMAPVHDAVPEYRWESSSCFLCHQRAEVPGDLEHTFFPVAPTDAHGEVSCADCHVNPDARRDVGCTTCHEHHGQEPMALVHAGVPDYSFQSSSCLLCHPGAEPAGLIDHSAMFPIAAGQTHGGLSCRDCHKTPDDRTAVACIACHAHDEGPMAAAHAGIGGYAWDSPSCLGCHPSGDPNGALDHSFFPIGDGAKHAGVSCAGCHVDDSDRSAVGCTSCHEHAADAMLAIHDGMPSYSWSSSACVGCHPSAQPTGLLEHPFFPVAVGQKHAGVSCAECHANRTDRSELSCTSCHVRADVDPPHLGVPEYRWEASSCFLCHPGAEVPGSIQHGSFPIDAPAVHDVVSCAECHTDPATRSEVGCTTCHAHEEPAMTAVHAAVPGYAWDSSSCLLCHPNADPAGLAEHPFFPIAAPSAHDAVRCGECHVNPATKSDVGCAGCHAAVVVDPIHAGIPGYAHSSASCVACHPQANVPGHVDHSPFFPIEQGQTHAGLSCGDCHSSRDDRSLLACTSCHAHEEPAMATVHALIAGYAWSSSSCVSCHPRGEAAGAFDHSSFFPIAAGESHAGVGCAECHVDGADPAVLGCAGCHAHQEADMSSVHALVPGYAFTSTACLACHPYGAANGNVVEHASYFPIEAGTRHEGVGCGQCHLDGQDPAENGCRECHAGIHDLTVEHAPAGVGTGLDTSSGCKLCHAEAQVSLVAQHGPFLVRSGTKHYRKRCLQCHSSMRADKPWAVDFERWTCLLCHKQPGMDDKHSGKPGYSYTNAACIGCHPQGTND